MLITKTQTIITDLDTGEPVRVWIVLKDTQVIRSASEEPLWGDILRLKQFHELRDRRTRSHGQIA